MGRDYLVSSADHAENTPDNLRTFSNFIPELWANEVIKAYKDNLLLGSSMLKVGHDGTDVRVQYVEDAGRALAERIDRDIVALAQK